ncbi:MAG: hypothetical protein WCP20_18970 [Desulfuromonadales bacterium]
MIKSNANKRRDFVALFNALWYRDFPVTPGHEKFGKRAVWTTHIASIVKQCADLMGLYTCFESGGRTDAVIQTSSSEIWAKIEWEWSQPRSEKVNEFDKLAASANESELLIYIGYSRSEHHEENLLKISNTWTNVKTPLLVFLVTFSFHSKRRHFDLLQTHYFKDGKRKLLRRQPALPWQVIGTKWALLANSSVNTDETQ